MSPSQLLFTYLKPYRGRLAYSLIAVILTASAVLGIGVALRYFVDHGIGEHNSLLLHETLAGLLGVVVVLAVASFARFHLVYKVSECFIADIRRDAFAHLLKQDVAFFDTRRSGDLISRLNADAAILQQILSSSLSVVLRNLIVFIGGMGLLLYTSWQLTLIVLAILPLVAPPLIFIGRLVRQHAREAQAKIGEMTSYGEEILSAMRAVQSASAETTSGHAFNALVDVARDTSLMRIHFKAILIGLIVFLVFGSIILVLWRGGVMMISDSITAGELSAFLFYSVLVAGAISALSEISTDWQRASGAAGRISELFDAQPAITAPASPAPLPDLGKAKIHFEKVSFAYPSRPDEWAVKDFNLTIKPAETVALVGASGAGKTTLFQLLLRFYDPQHGHIAIGDTDIRAFDPRELRAQIGTVMQDAMIFSDTIMNNVVFGLTPRLTSAPIAEGMEDEVTTALQAANAMDFVAKLPQGIHTYVGERGVQLSGGQKQRLAIARMIIRNPRIVLLDEATSALDTENERLVQAALNTLMQGRTTLVIAHRLSTVTHANRIVLMHEGSIEAIGSHAELMETSERYRNYVELQFSKGLSS